MKPRNQLSNRRDIKHADKAPAIALIAATSRVLQPERPDEIAATCHRHDSLNHLGNYHEMHFVMKFNIITYTALGLVAALFNI